jgi:hypothetical protein
MGDRQNTAGSEHTRGAHAAAAAESARGRSTKRGATVASDGRCSGGEQGTVRGPAGVRAACPADLPGRAALVGRLPILLTCLGALCSSGRAVPGRAGVCIQLVL